MIYHENESYDLAVFGFTVFEVETIDEVFRIYNRSSKFGVNMHFKKIEDAKCYLFMVEPENNRDFLDNYFLVYNDRPIEQRFTMSILDIDSWANSVNEMSVSGCFEGAIVVSEDAPFFKEAQQMIKLSEL